MPTSFCYLMVGQEFPTRNFTSWLQALTTCIGSAPSRSTIGLKTKTRKKKTKNANICSIAQKNKMPLSTRISINTFNFNQLQVMFTFPVWIPIRWVSTSCWKKCKHQLKNQTKQKKIQETWNQRQKRFSAGTPCWRSLEGSPVAWWRHSKGLVGCILLWPVANLIHILHHIMLFCCLNATGMSI